jgi:hypothetical protein
MARSLHGMFVSKNQTKVIYIYPPSTTRARDRFTPAIFPLSALPTPQDYQPHILVPSLAASTFTFGALSWRYRELKFLPIRCVSVGVGNFAPKHHYQIKIQVNSPPPFNGMLSLPVISPLYFSELIYILHLPAHKDGAGGRPT